MKQELYRKQLLEKKNDPPILCNVKKEKPEFTERIIIKPRIEPDGASSESVYSLEEKPTRATMAESCDIIPWVHIPPFVGATNPKPN